MQEDNDTNFNSSQNEEQKSEIEKAGDDLFHFAINRDELKWLMAHLHEQAEINRETVEYELQVLKIIATRWALAC